MSWLAIEKKLSETDPKYAKYIDRYIQEVPVEVQKKHNHFFPEYLVFPRIYILIKKVLKKRCCSFIRVSLIQERMHRGQWLYL